MPNRMDLIAPCHQASAQRNECSRKTIAADHGPHKRPSRRAACEYPIGSGPMRPGATSIAAALRYHARPPSANDHELLNDSAGALRPASSG